MIGHETGLEGRARRHDGLGGFFAALALLIWALAVPAGKADAQGDANALAPADRAETLADIRQELTQLAVEIARLKRELATTGQGGLGGMPAGSLPARVQALEEAVAHLTGKTEALERRIERIVEDGTRRIRDLEYRLVELEGGDVTRLANGGTTLLGGEEAEAGNVSTTPGLDPGTTGQESGTVDAAIGERQDFAAAERAFEAGDYQRAADLYARVASDYPGGAFSQQALYRRGEALEALGNHAGAARSFLEAYSSDPSGDLAADALYRVGAELEHLGKRPEACVTLKEVPRRYPGSKAAGEAEALMTELACPAE